MYFVNIKNSKFSFSDGISKFCRNGTIIIVIIIIIVVVLVIISHHSSMTRINKHEKRIPSTYTHIHTHFCIIRDGGGAGSGASPPPPDNFRRTNLTPTNYISLEKAFIGEYDSF